MVVFTFTKWQSIHEVITCCITAAILLLDIFCSKALPGGVSYAILMFIVWLQDFVQDSVQCLTQEVLEKVVSVNVEYRITGQVHNAIGMILRDSQSLYLLLLFCWVLVSSVLVATC